MNADDYAHNAHELAKARPHPKHPEYVQALKVRGPEGESRWLSIDKAQYGRVFEALTTEPGITYRVQPHDIISLTTSMFDACGIECPVMIGAPCPSRDSDQYMDGPADAAHYAKRCPGWSAKFPSAAAEVVYGWEPDERAGGNPAEWYGLYRTPADERHDDNEMGAGIILCELTTGAVRLTRFDSEKELTRDWAKIVAEYEDDEDDGPDPTYCALSDGDDLPCQHD